MATTLCNNGVQPSMEINPINKGSGTMVENADMRLQVSHAKGRHCITQISETE
jgi:hypothetical protein